MAEEPLRLVQDFNQPILCEPMSLHDAEKARRKAIGSGGIGHWLGVIVVLPNGE